MRWVIGKNRQWTETAMILLSFALIVICTVPPRHSEFWAAAAGLNWHSFFLGWGRSGDLDIVANILLFAPLGFSLANYLVGRRTLTCLPVLIVVVVVAFGFSYSIEVLQRFIPGRFSSLVDVLSNTLGGLVGFFCFLLWALRNLQVSLLAYVTLALLFSILLQKGTSLGNWDQTFYLFFGNEGTADRPWQGYISEIYFADRALSEAEIRRSIRNDEEFAFIKNSLLAHYQLKGTEDLHDSTGQLPSLIWRGEARDGSQKGTILLGPNHWLGTSSPASFLTEKIIKRSQFTLSATVATADIMQTGPARIVSLSRDGNVRNFTLGQQGRHLVFRLRTPVTGENGVNPPLIVPGVFSTKDFHHLVVTYDGSLLLLYVNGVRSPYILELSPVAAAVSYFLGLSPFNLRIFKLLYYALCFIPLGVLFALTTETMKERSAVWALVIIAGIALSSLLWETILVGVSGKAVSLENFLVSATWGIIGLVCCVFVRSCLAQYNHPSVGESKMPPAVHG